MDLLLKKRLQRKIKNNNHKLINLLLIASGGALGAVLRFLTSNIFKSIFHYSFFGTLFSNILGSFLIGLFVYFIKTKNVSQDLIQYFFIIGILGSYTTFSAFSLETIELINNNKFLLSSFYIIVSVSYV